MKKLNMPIIFALRREFKENSVKYIDNEKFDYHVSISKERYDNMKYNKEFGRRAFPFRYNNKIVGYDIYIRRFKI